MKRYLTLAVSLLLCAETYGQNLGTAMDMGNNFYYGTARSMALSNAMTAVGGDLGSIAINPAGGAVAGYSQVTLSPGLVISGNHSAFCSSYYDNNPENGYDFVGRTGGSATKFTFPNGGVNFNFDFGRESGLMSMNIGFVANRGDSYLDGWNCGGINPGRTSMTGAMAFLSDGIPYKALVDKDAYGNYDLPYFGVMAAGSNMIVPQGANFYRGASEIFDDEGSLIPCGDLMQRSSVSFSGSKTDLLFNVGFNIDDCLYLGVDLGVPLVSYSFSENLSESAVDGRTSGDFSYASYNYSMQRSASGIYGKFGVIWLPAAGLRLGFAVRTPTNLKVSDRYSLDGVTKFYSHTEDGRDGGDRGNNYILDTPYGINAGIAYTFAGRVLVSADYEMNDFRTSKFRAVGTNNSVFNAENTLNDLFLGFQHNFRAGIEVKPSDSFALRAGYGMMTGSEYYYRNSRLYGNPVGNIYSDSFDFEAYDTGVLSLGEKTLVPSFRHSFSFGAGYSSHGSFFADMAARCTLFPTRDYMIYDDYAYNGDTLVAFSPFVRSKNTLWDVVLTIGWRF